MRPLCRRSGDSELCRRPKALAVAAWRKAILCDADGKLATDARRAISRLGAGATTRPARVPAAAP